MRGRKGGARRTAASREENGRKTKKKGKAKQTTMRRAGRTKITNRGTDIDKAFRKERKTTRQAGGADEGNESGDGHR